jgi:hypothetical protein
VLFDSHDWERKVGDVRSAREDIMGQCAWVVCEMSVGEGFMTRRAVALEVICVAQGHVAGELFIYVWV